MQDRERLQEIEEIGEQEENEEELQNAPARSGHSTVPLIQTAFCVLVLLALLFLKYTDQEKYQSVTGYYQKAAAEEIELPKFQERQEASKALPSSAGNAETEQSDAGLDKI